MIKNSMKLVKLSFVTQMAKSLRGESWPIWASVGHHRRFENDNGENWQNQAVTQSV